MNADAGRARDASSEAERELVGAMHLLASLDPLVHEPSRFGILEVLCGDAPEPTRGELRGATGLGRQNLHNHLRKLKGAGYVREALRGEESVRVVLPTPRGEGAFRAHLEKMMRVDAASRPPGR